MPLSNPYTPGEPAHVLGGRAKELARITERLERVSILGEYGGSLLVFHSPRGIGKTSLLRQAQRAAVAAHFVTVWVSASPGSSLLAELAYSTRTAIASASFIAEKQKSTWSAEITQLEVQLGVPAANVKTTIEPTKNTPAPLPGPAPTVGEAPISALEGLLHSAAKLVRAVTAQVWSCSSMRSTQLTSRAWASC